MRTGYLQSKILRKQFYNGATRLQRVYIDIITSVDGLEFNESFKNKMMQVVDGLRINFICLSDFKKKIVVRSKDLADLEGLE